MGKCIIASEVNMGVTFIIKGPNFYSGEINNANYSGQMPKISVSAVTPNCPKGTKTNGVIIVDQRSMNEGGTLVNLD